MRTFFQELFEYDRAMTAGMIDQCLQAPDQITERAGQVLSHILLVHRLWNHMITGDTPVTDWWRSLPFEEMHDWLAANTATSLDILNHRDLDEVIDVPNPRGSVAHFKVRDILFHMINHGNYHRGQINVGFREAGVEPVKTDYILYQAMRKQG